MRNQNYYLFNGHSLHSVIDNHRRTVSEKLAKISNEEINSLTEDELAKKYVDEFTINKLVIRESDTELETKEKDIDVSYRTDLYWSTPGPHYKRGTVFKYYVPYEGDEVLLKCQPSTFSLSPPYAPIRNSHLEFEFEVFDDQNIDTDTQLDAELQKIQTLVDQVNKDIAPFNQQLDEMVRNSVQARKAKLAAIGSLKSKSKYKTRSTNDKDLVFPTTSLKPKAKVELPIQTTNNKPEPHINNAEYDRIMGLIKHTGISIERNAKTYQKMDEEELRDIILTQLNGHYEGKAAGEAFNAAGKTDILVRDDDKNVFIGECKIWSGAIAFTAAIDQLLSYTAWRDTKAALIIFSRNKDTSKVVEQIEDLVSLHPNYKRSTGPVGEAEFRFVLRHNADVDKELYLSVIVLDVPS